MGDIVDQIAFANKIREFCHRCYLPAKELPSGERNPLDHPSMRAEALAASECMVSLSRVFRALETFDRSFIAPLIVDLSFGLAENQFWKQHNTIFVTSYRNCLLAFMNGRALSMDKHQTSEKERYAKEQMTQWHNLFIIAFDCLYGITRTIDMSPAILQEIRVIL